MRVQKNQNISCGFSGTQEASSDKPLPLRRTHDLDIRKVLFDIII